MPVSLAVPYGSQVAMGLLSNRCTRRVRHMLVMTPKAGSPLPVDGDEDEIEAA